VHKRRRREGKGENAIGVPVPVRKCVPDGVLSFGELSLVQG
jgi:hypothetical protein